MQVTTEGLRACSRLFLYYFPLLFLFYAEERSAHIFDFTSLTDAFERQGSLRRVGHLIPFAELRKVDTESTRLIGNNPECQLGSLIEQGICNNEFN